MSDVRSPHTTVPFDLYRDIHKAIRVTLFDVVVEAGSLDPSDCTARIAHATRVHDLVKFLVQHAEHEDTHMEATIQQVLPDQAEAIAAEHVALEEQMADLIDLADLVFEAGRDDAKAAMHDLYLDLASFTSRYLAHQEVEERVVMPALWNACGFEPLVAIHQAILKSIPPDDMAKSLSKMLPAMNIDGRTELLGAMRATAPAPAFAGVCALAQQVLKESDFAALSQRLDLQPSPAV
jgi:Hemerythrin HHE cation binding domain